MKTIKVITLFTICISIWSCDNSAQKENQKTQIVCTTNIIGDVVKTLVGSTADVIVLMGPGVDPHLYKASQKDLEYLQKADVVVENGLHLEGKMADVLHKLARTKTVITMSDGVDQKNLILVSEDIYDPHIWFDVILWTNAMQHTSLALQEAFPELKDSIIIKSNIYKRELVSLNNWVNEKTGEVDSLHRVLITAHDAFSYFGNAYSFEVKGLQGISTQSDYGLQDISNLVNFITEREIKALFVETSVPKKPLEAVIEGCRQKGHPVKIGGSLYSDALGGADEEGNTYINMVKHNVSTIANALK